MSVCFGVGCETLCRGCFEFLGCGVGYGVDFCLYASVLDAERCAEGGCSGTVMRFSTCNARLRNSAVHVAYSREPQSMRHIQPEFRNLCGICGQISAIYIMQQYILQKYTKFRLIYFGSVSNCLYRSIQIQVSFFQLSTVAALYKKGPGVCRGARPCAPLRFSHIPM